jgi:hypothetical protein
LIDRRWRQQLHDPGRVIDADDDEHGGGLDQGDDENVLVRLAM